jgi:hypothetical protein
MIRRNVSVNEDFPSPSSSKDIEGGSSSMDRLVPRASSTYKMSGLPSFLDLRGVTINSLAPIVLCSVVSAIFSLLFFGDIKYFILIWAICIVGLCFCAWLFAWCLNKDTGTEDMRAVANPIREGAESFLSVQYQYIMRISVFAMLFIFLSYKLRVSHAPESGEGSIDSLSTSLLGFIAVISFIFGALCSGFAGYAAMWVAAQANVRVASAAQRSFNEGNQSIVVSSGTWYLCPVVPLTIVLF